jgi:tRNA (mo5U34)-methyltransferase
MNDVFGLAGKQVLEIGCFEGVHTVGLCTFGARVLAVDARVENVVKTIVRTAMFGFHPEVAVCDVEKAEDLARLPSVDFVHHVGVLYHLVDPVAHLRRLAGQVRRGMMIDSHVATAEMAKNSYESGGTSYRYYRHREGGASEVFSGMYDHAKWLLLDDLVAVLRAAGFTKVDVIEVRPERNGPRVRLHASRTAGA